MCVFFLNSNVFFAFAIIEYESLGDQEIFFPWGKKISWSALALAWEDFLLFWGGWGGGKEVNEGQHLPCCFYLHLLLDMLCVVRNFYVNLLVSRRHSQSGGWGARRLMRRPAPTMLFLFAFVIRHALCQKLCKSVGQSTRSINMLML